MQDKIRNFSLIAHIDHGKSTLADRILETTGVITGTHRQQFLDSLDLERERGITIKAKTVSIDYRGYTLNLVDTPGHVDFSYEVSRSLSACEGTLLLVDASQGVEAQTLANCELALRNNMEVIPVINKIDLHGAMVEKTREEIMEIVPVSENEIMLVSAKTGQGIDELLEAVIKRIPPPSGKPGAPLRALVFDSFYDTFKGAVVYIRIVDGVIKKGMKVKSVSSDINYEVLELGVYRITAQPRDSLSAGEIGYLVAGIRDISEVKIGDTVTETNAEVEPLPGFREIKPFVFSSFYPLEDTSPEMLKQALEKLHLNDASFEFHSANSPTLGFGFRVGFLGTLHLEIVRERLEREFGLRILTTAPNVIYKILLKNGKEVYVDNPQEWPGSMEVESVFEPMVKTTVVTPAVHMSAIMELFKDRRGKYVKMHYMNPQRVVINFQLPLSEMITDFYSNLKSVSKGYASLDYEHHGYEEADLVKMDILLNQKPVEGLSLIIPRDRAYYKSRDLVDRLQKVIPRQMYEVAIQAAIGGKIIARSNVVAIRKDVTAKCYGGDITRKRKLLEKQKEGKKKLKKIGQVDVPQEAFWEVWK
ncbi:MAG TPA: translation elongation factor 4 [bacterium]|nr:translation elongation factor 4 [bacterium]